MEEMFFDGWLGLLRTVVVGVLAYLGLVVILRISGKRTLSKLNAFDLVVTVSLGSTLATVLLNKNVALAEGLLAFALLAGLQYAVTWSSIRWKWVHRFTKSEPALLLYRGQLQPRSMRRERITLDEIEAAVRLAKIHRLEDVDAVVLETDGTLSVVPANASSQPPVIAGIDAPQQGSDATQ